MHETFHANVLFYNGRTNVNLVSKEALSPKLYDRYWPWICKFIAVLQQFFTNIFKISTSN